MTFAAVMELDNVQVILILLRRFNVLASHIGIPNAYVKEEKEKAVDIYTKVSSGMQVSQDI